MEQKLKDFGREFHQSDQVAFRAVISASGYYRQWKETFAPEAWTLLEKCAGPLA